jgi:hypothetical protein
MPSIRISNQATSANALNGLKFSKLAAPALLSLWASGVTGTDEISFSVGDREILRLANPNIESSADVVDTARDGILIAEPAGGGEDLFMTVTATTAVNYLLLIDEL